MTISYIASADIGNGGCNLILTKPNGKPKMYYEPTVRAVASGGGLGLGDMEMQYTTIDWYGHRYVTGDDVVRVTRRSIERHMGQDRYGNEFHQFMTATVLAKAGVKSGEIDLTLFCPPGHFTRMRPIILKNFVEEEGIVKIRLSGDKSQREWRYTNVSVLPEGIGAIACFTLDETGKPIVSDFLTGDMLLLDIGVHTFDVVIVSNGQFNPETLQTATWDGYGMDTFIRRPILDLLHKQDPDYTILTVDDIDLALREGCANGMQFEVRCAGKKIDIGPALQKASARYADWIANTVLDGVYNGLRGIKHVVVIGGGAFFVGDHLRDLFPDKIVNLKDYAQTKKVLPSDMNAVGGARLAMHRLRKQGLIE
jgi:hypothetical protein